MTDQLFRFSSRSLLAFIILVSSALLIIHFDFAVSGPNNIHFEETHNWIVALIGFIANFYLVYFHITRPPHPKFMLQHKRKVLVRIHAAFGVVEIIVGSICLFQESALLASIFGYLALAHAITSFFQTPTVFGAKAVMIPGYLFASVLHGYTAVQLILEPTAFYWVMNTFLVLNTYAYVRLLMFMFNIFGVFKHSHYTASVLIAGLIIFTAVLGSSASLILFFYIALYIVVNKFIFNLSKHELRELWIEKTRIGFINQQKKNEWILKSFASEPDLSKPLDTKLLTDIFNTLDKNKNGYLEPAELEDLLKVWGVSSEGFNPIKSYITEQLDFNSFCKIVKIVNSMSDFLRLIEKDPNHTDRDKAKVVFDQLDFDKSGYIDQLELELLLLEYGLPKHEAKKYMKRFDDNKDSQISFEEFFSNLRPLWNFIYKYAM